MVLSCLKCAHSPSQPLSRASTVVCATRMSHCRRVCGALLLRFLQWRTSTPLTLAGGRALAPIVGPDNGGHVNLRSCRAALCPGSGAPAPRLRHRSTAVGAPLCRSSPAGEGGP